MGKEDGQREIPDNNSFELPTVNPFIHRWKLSRLQKIQIFFMSCTIAPLRFIMVSFLMMITWAIAYISTIGLEIEVEKPVRSWRRLSLWILQPLVRLVFFFLGVVWVEQKGSPASYEETDAFVVAPHSTFYDGIPCAITVASVVAKKELMSAPVLGTLMRVLQPVLVSRHDPESRQNTILEIQRRIASSDKWPQIIIFPEGTCTNRKALITFKAGGFIPGVPVQPVLIRYPNQLDTCTWTMNGPGAFKLLWFSLCQFYIRVQVEFLPVYKPSKEEIDDPRLYADNVRQIMAKALGVPCTDHTFEDCRLMYQAKSRNLPMETGLVEFSKLNRKLGIDIDEMKILLDEFAAISRVEDGLIGIEDFAQHLKLPITKPLQGLFDLYDRDGSGMIDFREYVIGLSLVSHAAVTEKTMKLAFKVFDRDGDGLVSRDQLDHALKSVFGPEFIVDHIYEKIDTEGKGRIDYDQFYAFVKKRPEYAKLFVPYTELEEDDIPVVRSNVRMRNNNVKSIADDMVTNHENNLSREKKD